MAFIEAESAHIKPYAVSGSHDARKGNPEEEKQDSKRVYYQITKEGFKALQRARKLQKSLWQGIPEFVSDAGKK